MLCVKIVLIFTCPVIYCHKFGCDDYLYRVIASDCLEDIIINSIPDPEAEISRTIVSAIIVNNNGSQSYEIQSMLIKKIHEKFQVRINSVEDTDDCLLDTCEYENCQNGKKYQSHIYLIILENEDDFDDLFEKLKKSETFNPDAYYLLYIENVTMNAKSIAENLLKKMWDNLLAYSGVLVPERLQTFRFYELNLRTRDLFICGSQIEVYLSDTCEKGRMLNSQNKYFQADTSIIIGNCTVNVIAKYYPPFVIDRDNGFEIEVLKTIGSILNVQFNITMDTDVVDSWGSKIDDTWTGNLNFVYNEMYIGIGNIETGMENATTDFDFSHFYHMEPLVYVVPAAKLVPKWRVLTAIFTIEMWGVCAAILIIFAVTFYCLSRFSKQDSTGPQTPLLFSFQILIGQATDKHPVNDLQRIFFVSLSILSIIISSIYTCSLIYYLKNPIKQHQITDADEVFDVFGNMRYDIGGISKYRLLYNVTDSAETQNIFERYQSLEGENETVEYWLELVGKRDDLWTISSEFFVKYSIAVESDAVTYPDGQFKVLPLSQPLLSYSVSIIMRKGHPLLKKINSVIKMLLHGGFVSHFCRAYLSEIGKSITEDNKENTNPFEALTLEHLQGAFAVLLLGYISGGIMLLFEQLSSNICSKST